MFKEEKRLPIDTLLRPRDRYTGSDPLPLALERMHQAFYLVRERIQKQAEKNKEYYDRKNNVKHTEYAPGDPVWIRNYSPIDKLSPRWLAHYRILRKTGELSYVVQSQVTGKTRRVHLDALKMANPDDQWDAPHGRVYNGRAVRNALYGLTDQTGPNNQVSETSDEEVMSDDEQVSEGSNSDLDTGDDNGQSDNELSGNDLVETVPSDPDMSESEVPVIPVCPTREAKLKALDKL